MATAGAKHKHLILDQKKVDFAKRYFGVKTEREAIERALAMLMEEQRIIDRIGPLAGVLAGDTSEWPYR